MSIFEMRVKPRFCETDALGHINNTIFPIWCEAAREPIFKIFNPEQKLETWNLIVANLNVAFKAPAYFPDEMLVTTTTTRLGRSSFDLTQRIEQNSVVVADVVTTMVYYDYERSSSLEIPDGIRQKLMSD